MGRDAFEKIAGSCHILGMGLWNEFPIIVVLRKESSLYRVELVQLQGLYGEGTNEIGSFHYGVSAFSRETVDEVGTNIDAAPCNPIHCVQVIGEGMASIDVL